MNKDIVKTVTLCLKVCKLLYNKLIGNNDIMVINL